MFDERKARDFSLDCSVYRQEIKAQSSGQNIWDDVERTDFTGKQCDFFGLGDQLGYSEWFVDAMGLLHDKVVHQGGLAVDEVNQCHLTLTDEHIKIWCEQATGYHCSRNDDDGSVRQQVSAVDSVMRLDSMIAWMSSKITTSR